MFKFQRSRSLVVNCRSIYVKPGPKSSEAHSTYLQIHFTCGNASFCDICLSVFYIRHTTEEELSEVTRSADKTLEIPIKQHTDNIPPACLSVCLSINSCNSAKCSTLSSL